MKNLFFVFLIVGIVLVFFGCSENIPTAPELNQSHQIADQSDLVVTTLTNPKTIFTGTSTMVELVAAGTFKPLPNGKTLMKGRISKYYDDTSDPRVTGYSFWYVDGIFNEDGSGKMQGKAELIVDGDGGKWEMSWHGSMAADGSIIDYVVGTGKEGAVKGLVAKWTYIRLPGQAGFYSVEGVIY